jgi:hypothetical protein
VRSDAGHSAGAPPQPPHVRVVHAYVAHIMDKLGPVADACSSSALVYINQNTLLMCVRTCVSVDRRTSLLLSLLRNNRHDRDYTKMLPYDRVAVGPEMTSSKLPFYSVYTHAAGNMNGVIAIIRSWS